MKISHGTFIFSSEEYFLTVSSFPKLKIFDTGLAFLSLWIL